MIIKRKKFAKSATKITKTKNEIKYVQKLNNRNCDGVKIYKTGKSKNELKSKIYYNRN